ncbi:MAG: RNA polymerase subunit sigma-70, partial [Acidobacteriota bacterium]
MPETKPPTSSKTQEPLVSARPDEEGVSSFSSVIQRPGESLPKEVSGRLQKLDPLSRYLLEVSRYEPLSGEEEHRLALLYRDEGDQQAAYRLVT